MATKQLKTYYYHMRVRRHKASREIEIFMRDNGQLACYSRGDGHTQCSYEYMRDDTEPVDDETALWHFNHYIKDFPLHIVPVLNQQELTSTNIL